jgi:hypothetical protein
VEPGSPEWLALEAGTLAAVSFAGTATAAAVTIQESPL